MSNAFPIPSSLKHGIESALGAAVHDISAASRFNSAERTGREALPHGPNARIDYDKTKIGYEIPFTGHFYRYVPPRPLEEIEEDLRVLVGQIQAMLAEVGA